MSYPSLTLSQVLRSRSERQPDKIVYRFLDRGTETGSLTYAQLNQRAGNVAAALTARNLVGERIGMVFAPGLDFMVAFWGCMQAGAIPVPVFPPRDRSTAARMAGVLRDAGAVTVLTTKEVLSRTRLLRWTDSALRKLAWLPVDKMPDSPQVPLAARAEDPSAIAFLQYTSGSTSDPKGVMVSHSNLMNNAQVIHESVHLTDESVIVGWIPLYHDMGLIGNVLQAVYSGGSYVGMSPIDFLLRPFDFFEAVSRYRGNVTAMPNFGFELAMRKVNPAKLATLDLSSWTTCLNGAEQVRLNTILRFAETFASCGLSPFAIRPSFGLAEATLIVSIAEAGTPVPVLYANNEALERNRLQSVHPSHPQARALVGCGTPRRGQEVAIVDPETLLPCAHGEVGEIWLAGPSMALGYWGREQQTADQFGAQMAGSSKTYVRSGDLGFLHQGELYVTGRLKDMIVLRGRNVYPQDVELSVERADDAIRKGCCAAVSVDIRGEERLVVVAEVRREFDLKGAPELLETIRRCITEDLEMGPYAIQLLAAGSVPKTSSGKIRRRAIAQAFQAETLKTVKGGRWTSSGIETIPERAPGNGLVAPAVDWIDVRAPQSLDELVLV